jgi:hypothetical protein
MIAQYIQLGDRDWNILVYYNVQPEDFVEVSESLDSLDCPKKDKRKALNALRRKNTGFTFSNTDYKMSIVCIGQANNVGEFINTVIHESKHVQSHICQYYGIKEDTETAAYLIGHIAHRMYKMLEKILRSYI